MRAVLQRVSHAHVVVEDKTVGSIKQGWLVLLGIGNTDTAEDAAYLLDKIQNLRLFADEQGKFNRSVLDINGELLIVSQFTLYADCRKGRRPSFTDAANPENAKLIYNQFVTDIRRSGLKVETGEFQATMQVALENDGPVTIFLDSKQRV